MAYVFLDSKEQGIVVFKIWKSLAYKTRLFISLGFILAGFIIQVFTYSFFPGVVAIFLGNLFLLPSGYNNRVNLGLFDPQTDWEKIEKDKLMQLLAFQRKMKKWDRSTIDASNGLGGFIFFVLLLVLGIVTLIAFVDGLVTMQILGVDAIVLLLPFWVTGLRSIFTVPKVTMKIEMADNLLKEARDRLKNHKVEYYILLKGQETKVPMDVKFKVSIAGQHKDFLGYYGQITLNNVNSTSYPYFYVVMVAKKDFGLNRVYRSYTPPKNLVKEFKTQQDVEVLVVRQNTDVVRNGYHTREKQAMGIFLEGLGLAEKAAAGNEKK